MARRAGLIAAALLGQLGLAGCVAPIPIPLLSPARTSAPAAASSTTASGARTIGTSPFAGPWTSVSFEMASWASRSSPGGCSPMVAAAGPGPCAPTAPHAAVTASLGTIWAPMRNRRGCCGHCSSNCPTPRRPARVAPTSSPISLMARYGSRKVRAYWEMAYNAGCRDAAYQPFLEGLRAADTLVGKRGEQAPVTQEEQPTQAAGK